MSKAKDISKAKDDKLWTKLVIQEARARQEAIEALPGSGKKVDGTTGFNTWKAQRSAKCKNRSSKRTFAKHVTKAAALADVAGWTKPVKGGHREGSGRAFVRLNGEKTKEAPSKDEMRLRRLFKDTERSHEDHSDYCRSEMTYLTYVTQPQVFDICPLRKEENEYLHAMFVAIFAQPEKRGQPNSQLIADLKDGETSGQRRVLMFATPLQRRKDRAPVQSKNKHPNLLIANPDTIAKHPEGVRVYNKLFEACWKQCGGKPACKEAFCTAVGCCAQEPHQDSRMNMKTCFYLSSKSNGPCKSTFVAKPDTDLRTEATDEIEYHQLPIELNEHGYATQV
jgi:hypothetical protein